MNNITAVIVSYNRADLLKRAYESIRVHYPELPVIIVDGSEVTNECYDYVDSIKHDRTEVIRPGKNIGHGKGMEIGIKYAKTNFILLMDSDASIIRPRVLENMLMHHCRVVGDMREVFGVGQVVTVNDDGTNVNAEDPFAIQYLHPYFALISKEVYMKVPGFVHHGAPCIRTMQYIHSFKKYMLVEFPVDEYVLHEGRGTRKLNPPEFLRGWES